MLFNLNKLLFPVVLLLQYHNFHASIITKKCPISHLPYPFADLLGHTLPQPIVNGPQAADPETCPVIVLVRHNLPRPQSADGNREGTALSE